MMAKELRHKDAVSARVREDEFEHTRQHIINSQATGDLVYASSATQLSGLAVGADNYILSVATDTPAWISPASLLADISPLTTRGDIMFRNATISTRLAKGAANTVLVMGADDPAWSATLAGLTLTSPTLGGTLSAAGHGIVNASTITITDGNSFRCNVDNGFIRVSGGTDINSATIQLSGKSREPNPGMFQIFTPIADLSYTPRLSISGAVATAVAAWSGVYHTGVKFGLAGVATGAFTIDGSTSGVVTVTVNAEAGTWTMTLPAAVGTAGYFLVDAAGNGITSWSNTLPAATVAAGYIQFTEMAAPGALGANTAGIYAVVGGDTLTDLAAVFQDGTVDIFAEESTDPDSPIFRYPDGTEFKSILKKPDKKTVQFVALFPDGSEFVMREKRYPVERWN